MYTVYLRLMIILIWLPVWHSGSDSIRHSRRIREKWVEESIQKEYEITKSTCQYANAGDQLKIVSGEAEGRFRDLVGEWVK
jgi:hypothetical protein